MDPGRAGDLRPRAATCLISFVDQPPGNPAVGMFGMMRNAFW